MIIDSISLPELPGISLVAGATEFPVTAMDITGNVDGDGVVWTVTANFENPLDAPIEATFTIPLPVGGAVVGMSMTIGERVIAADIKERGAAQVEYEEAKDQGFTAALFEQDRAEIFTISVGNVHPGEGISVSIEIHDRVAIDTTEATLRMPTMIKPRYIPQGVPDAEAINPPRVSHHNPLQATVSIIFAQDAEELMCETIPQAVVTPQKVAITNCDLTCDIIVRWTLPIKMAHAKWVADSDNTDFGTLEVNIRVPETNTQTPRRKAVQIMFDRSGSMDGHYLEWARRIVDDLITSLTDQDLIHILTFDSKVEVLATTEHGFVPATRTNKKELQQQLAKVTARGGTELTDALQAAGDALAMVDDRSDSTEFDRVAVLISDGAYGDESSAIFHRDNHLKGARVIAVAIGENANGFLEVLAANGVCVFVSSESGLAAASNKIMSRVVTAAHSQARLIAAGFTDQAPTYAPDIYPNVAVNMTGRMPRPKEGDTVEIAAISGTVITLPIVVSEDASATTRWANQHIKSLDFTMMSSNFADSGIETHDALEARITELSIKHKVLSKYTAWIAVDRTRTTEQVIVRKLAQPVYEHFDAAFSLQSSSIHAFSSPNINRLAYSLDSPMRPRPRRVHLVHDQTMILIALRLLLEELLRTLEADALRDNIWNEINEVIEEWLTKGNPESLGKRLSKKIESRMTKLQVAQESGVRAKKKLATELLDIIKEITVESDPFEWDEDF